MTLTLDEMNRRIAARDAERDRPRVVVAEQVRSKIKRKPRVSLLCALCCEDIPRPDEAPDDWTPRQEPLGRNDAMVSICEGCATGPIVERDHLFGSKGVGVGEGNRRTPSKAAVRR